MKKCLLLLPLLLAPCLTAQVAVRDNFDSGSYNSAWDLVAGVNVTQVDGANDSLGMAYLSAYTATTGRDLGARFDEEALSGANAFYIDCFFRVRATAQRQFNLQVSDSAGAIGNGAATLNLRYQAGWAAYSGGAWRTIAGLGAVAAEQWYRLRVTGTNWGGNGASFSLELSDANTAQFTTSVTGLNHFQNGNPTNNLAHFFLFTSAFGNCPGFDVDEVSAAVTAAPFVETNAILNISGTYPHLAVFSADGEIGMGAVVPWADRLWFVTYPPHQPLGSADKLWTVDTNLTLLARPESVGGTHANRMIHRESGQLVMGPYFIDSNANVRVVPPATMPGRLTANARHLTDPTNRIYFATMEEGFYEVNVNTLAVTTLKVDAQNQTSGNGLVLPGNHGKGCYSGQGRVVYANNGEPTWVPAGDPGFTSQAGLLAENTGLDFTNGWSVLERKNFTEVTGPGGLAGNAQTTDPLWALGWDKRSVLLKLLDHGQWHNYRLPKGSYTHDSFQGWYTEWPRIREINDGKMLMHMHGLFYHFPKTFAAAATGGIQPICTYLKMPVDYGWWNGQLVMGRDDSSTTGGNIWAGQSHSAPWFGQISDLEQWGAPAGFGGPLKEDAVTANTPGEPFLVAGFRERVLHLRHTTANAVGFGLEYDAAGDGHWSSLTNLVVAASGYTWFTLPTDLAATWVRIVPAQTASGVTAFFHLANPPTSPTPGLFGGLADVSVPGPVNDAIIRPRSGDARTLQMAATLLSASGASNSAAYYEIGGGFVLRRTTNDTAESTLRRTYSLSNANFTVDAASVLYIEGTNRFRLPKNATNYDTAFASGWPRGAREVVTERQLFNAHGTFYELPHSGSGGFRRLRPVTTHNKHISDFASWRGLLVLAGISASATNDGHIFRSDDGRAALWFGNVDDLWRMGPPAGVGGPWKNSPVVAGVPSDPYLMVGYRQKVLELSHQSGNAITFVLEVDFAADNTWSEYARFTVQPGQTVRHVFPTGYSAHWARLKSEGDTTATATFTYGAAAPRIGGLAPLPNGRFQLSFDGPVGQSYSVRATDRPTSALNSWETLTNGTFGNSSIVYEDAATAPNRCYLISIP